MRMHVDEPGRDDQPARVDHAPCAVVRCAERTDRLDPVAADRHVAQKPGVAGPVDDLAAADQDDRRARRAAPGPECEQSIAAATNDLSGLRGNFEASPHGRRRSTRAIAQGSVSFIRDDRCQAGLRKVNVRTRNRCDAHGGSVDESLGQFDGGDRP